MNGFISVSFLIPEAAEEELAAVLGECSTLGAWLEAAEDGLVRAVVFLDRTADREATDLESRLEALGALRITGGQVAEHDWLGAYRRSARPFPVGDRLWIDPRPDGSGKVPEGRVRLRIEPSAAFGSGSHESTALALAALEELPLAGATVLDLGTGSGILAFAADALGARLVVGADLDPWAVWVARRTLRQQVWSARPVFLVGSAGAVARGAFDIVVCNIISSGLRPLLPEIHDRLVGGGRAILAGMLVSELPEMREAAGRSRLRERRTRTLREWAVLEAERG